MKKRMKGGNNVVEFNLGDYMQRGNFALRPRGRVLTMGQKPQRWTASVTVTGEPDPETGDQPVDDYVFTPTTKMLLEGMISSVAENLTADWGGKSASIDVVARIL